jgi:hypothetical protein
MNGLRLSVSRLFVMTTTCAAFFGGMPLSAKFQRLVVPFIAKVLVRGPKKV